MPPRYFDGHNDLLSHLLGDQPEQALKRFITGYDAGHLDLPRMQQGGFVGGLFALWIPPLPTTTHSNLAASMAERVLPYDIPLPPEMTLCDALPALLAEIGLLLQLEHISQGAIRRCMSRSEIDQAMQDGAIAVVLHLEGSEALDPEMRHLEVLRALGLKSIGPLWSRPTRFGHGVPFRAPSSPDTGPGLTPLGVELVRYCSEHRLLLDIAHLNARGVDDIARHSALPVVASHSNAHALCPHARNLTDAQLELIRSTEGLVGLNFATSYLRADAAMNADTPLRLMLEQLDYLIEHVGEDHVGLGSDFDGATIPAEIKDVAGIGALRTAMLDHGYGDALVEKIFWQNWLDVLERVWGPSA